MGWFTLFLCLDGISKNAVSQVRHDSCALFFLRVPPRHRVNLSMPLAALPPSDTQPSMATAGDTQAGGKKIFKSFILLKGVPRPNLKNESAVHVMCLNAFCDIG